MSLQLSAPSTSVREVPVEPRSFFIEQFDLRINQICALLIIALLSPVLVALYVLIKRSGDGPVLFKHYRLGQTGQLFRCWKFRTMVMNSQEVLKRLLDSDPEACAEWDLNHKLTHDPRITRIGAFLRKSSLDELPQLFNVVRGEMNLVGPRPITVAELRKYGTIRWHYFAVRPGMTGLWQVSGRNNTTYEERVALDCKYVQQRSMVGDLMILIKTVRVVLARDGAR